MLKTVISLAGLALASGAFAAAQDSVPATKLVPAAEKPAPAQDAPAPEAMTIGSPAPKPEIETFVRGEEPKWFDGDKTYVVEFWATWCGPCRASMPHISDLADKYEGKVVVVGVSDEKVDVVRKFLDTDEWKQKARYNLCTDPDRSTHRQYMEAAGQNGIPTAFVVKGGTVQWIGHPMGMDEPLEKIVAGEWDATAYKAEFEAEAAAARKQMQRRREIAKARKDGNWDAIMKMIDEDIAAAPDRQKAGLRMQKFMMLLTDAKMPEKGYAVGREIFESSKDDAMTLNQLAWFVLDDKRVAQRDIPFALEVAKQAVTASGGDDAAIMDTLARAWWESGDKAKAVEWQKKAVDEAEGDAADEMRATLRKYESGDAPAPTKKTSLRVDDADEDSDSKDGDAPAAKPGDAPAAKPADAPTAPRAPRAPRPGAKLTASAEKVFPEIEPQGFDTPEDLVAFAPKANADFDSLMRIVRSMRASTDEGKVSLRIAAAMMSDMRPMAEAQVKQFGKAGSMPMAMPGAGAEGVTFEVKPESDTEALLVAKDAKGEMVGQPRPLVKADGKWWFDFEKGSGMRPGEGAQTVMMANMMGQDMRTAMKSAATSTSKRVLDGEFKSAEEANSAFAQAMQMQMMELMGGGMGGPGGPGGRMGGPRGPGAPAGGNAPAPPAAPPAPPAGDAPKQP